MQLIGLTAATINQEVHPLFAPPLRSNIIIWLCKQATIYSVYRIILKIKVYMQLNDDVYKQKYTVLLYNTSKNTLALH